LAVADQIGIFTDNNNDYSLQVVAGPQEQLSISASGFFTFGNLGTIFDNSPRAAVLNMIATSSTAAGLTGSTVNESGFSGQFTITDSLTSTLLLHGVFGPGGGISGTSGGTSATFSDSTTGPSPTDVVFTSDYLDFALSTTQAFAFGLSNIAPGLSVTETNGFLVGATAAGTGTFSADPMPESKTPEPASMFLGGGALLGLGALLRKRKAQPVL
jgi:hypothetical protein